MDFKSTKSDKGCWQQISKYFLIFMKKNWEKFINCFVLYLIISSHLKDLLLRKK